MGLEAMEELPKHCQNEGVYEIWASLFNGVQVMYNRTTPVHRDNSSSHAWFDLLVTIGPYNTCFLHLPGVGLYFAYSSGTVVGICGRLLRHEVFDFEGERLGLAYYMRKNVVKRLGTNPAGWANHR